MQRKSLGQKFAFWQQRQAGATNGPDSYRENADCCGKLRLKIVVEKPLIYSLIFTFIKYPINYWKYQQSQDGCGYQAADNYYC